MSHYASHLAHEVHQKRTERIASLEHQIREIEWDDGSWCAGKDWREAKQMAREKLARLRAELATLKP